MLQTSGEGLPVRPPLDFLRCYLGIAAGNFKAGGRKPPAIHRVV
jgi:hypothetical protein